MLKLATHVATSSISSLLPIPESWFVFCRTGKVKKLYDNVCIASFYILKKISA